MKTSLPCWVELVVGFPRARSALVLHLLWLGLPRWLTVRLWLSPLMTSPTSERTEWHLSVWGGRKEGRPLLSHRLRTMAKLSFSDTSVPLT